MRYKTSLSNSSRGALAIAVAIILCAAIPLAIITIGRGVAMTSDGFVAAAGVIVGASTLASIAFGVISYLEANAFEKHVQRALSELERAQEEGAKSLDTLKNASFEVGDATVRGLLESFIALPSGNGFENVVEGLHEAKLNIDLARGSYESLMAAIEASYKLSRKRFLMLEKAVREAAHELEAAQAADVLRRYEALKAGVLSDIV